MAFFSSPSELIIFSLAAFHSLAVFVFHYPRAKHISSIGHSVDQWRGKAQERLKSSEGEGEGEGGVPGETGPFTASVIQRACMCSPQE